MKTMKFVQKCASQGLGRAGTITEITRLPNLTIQTPALMLFTKGASVPHLTHEVLQMLTKDPHTVQLPLLTTLQMQKSIETQGEGIAKFAGVGDHLCFMVLQDPTVDIPQTKLEKYHMPLWTRMGKREIDADVYMDLVEIFKPDMYAVLCDGCTNDASSNKRISKSIDRSAAMFSGCLERHKKSEFLSKNSSILGVIEGGNCLDQRKRSLEQLLEKSSDLGGFILDGVETNGPELEHRSYETVQTIVSQITERLPENKLRVVQGCWNPVAVLDFIIRGWDLFDSSLPYIATERGAALTFLCDPAAVHRPPGKNDSEGDESPCYEIDLHDPRYSEDFRPVLEGCSCLCCSKYTRAYINHLLNTKELLSSVLLMVHNLHHYLEFFKAIRANVTTENLTKMRKLISEQFNRHEAKRKSQGTKKPIAEPTKRRRRLSEDSKIKETG